MPDQIEWPEGTPLHLTQPVPPASGVRTCECGARVRDGDSHTCPPERPEGGESR